MRESELYNGFRLRIWRNADGRSCYGMHDQAGVCRRTEYGAGPAIAWAHAQPGGGWVVETDRLRIHETFALDERAEDETERRQ